MLICVDPSSAEPLFAQLAAEVRGQLVSGALIAGERLPAARELAEALQINVHTVLRAYQLLRDEGLLELRRGRGAVITAQAVEYGRLPQLIAPVIAEAKRLG